MKSPAQPVALTPIINATAEQLYAAWTQPELMQCWMAQKVETDVHLGGHYRNEIDAGEIGSFTLANTSPWNRIDVLSKPSKPETSI